MKVGDLVKYQEKNWHASEGEPLLGIVLAISNNYPEEACPIRVQWANHNYSQRDWYAEEELTKVVANEGW